MGSPELVELEQLRGVVADYIRGQDPTTRLTRAQARAEALEDAAAIADAAGLFTLDMAPTKELRTFGATLAAILAEQLRQRAAQARLYAVPQQKEEHMEQKPSIGRIVHYQAHGSPNGQHKSEPRPAIITKVHNDTCVDMTVFNPTGMFFNQSVVQGGPEVPGSWFWPPRV